MHVVPMRYRLNHRSRLKALLHIRAFSDADQRHRRSGPESTVTLDTDLPTNLPVCGHASHDPHIRQGGLHGFTGGVRCSSSWSSSARRFDDWPYRSCNNWAIWFGVERETCIATSTG